MNKTQTKAQEIDDIKSAIRRLEGQLERLGEQTDRQKIYSMLIDQEIGKAVERKHLTNDDELFGAMVFAGIVRNKIDKMK